MLARDANGKLTVSATDAKGQLCIMEGFWFFCDKNAGTWWAGVKMGWCNWTDTTFISFMTSRFCCVFQTRGGTVGWNMGILQPFHVNSNNFGLDIVGMNYIKGGCVIALHARRGVTYLNSQTPPRNVNAFCLWNEHEWWEQRRCVRVLWGYDTHTHT